MNISEAKNILNDNGYILEDSIVRNNKMVSIRKPNRRKPMPKIGSYLFSENFFKKLGFKKAWYTTGDVYQLNKVYIGFSIFGNGFYFQFNDADGYGDWKFDEQFLMSKAMKNGLTEENAKKEVIKYSKEIKNAIKNNIEKFKNAKTRTEMMNILKTFPKFNDNYPSPW